MRVKTFVKVLAFLFTLTGIATLGVILYFAYFQREKIYTDTGLNLEFGDHLGSLIGGFVGVFFTIAGVLLLYRTLQLQREEFAKTQQAIITQQFETTFFNMLNVLHNLVVSIEGPETEETNSKNYTGYRFLYIRLNQLKTRLMEAENDDTINIQTKVKNLQTILTTDIESLENHVSNIYESFYEKSNAELGHYFRYLYNIVKFVIDHRTGKLEQKKYLSLIQAQLSSQEMGLVFYNSVSQLGKDSSGIKQFKLWLDEYSLLENIHPSSLESNYHHILFGKTTFKFSSLDERAWKKNNMTKTMIN